MVQMGLVSEQHHSILQKACKKYSTTTVPRSLLFWNVWSKLFTCSQLVFNVFAWWHQHLWFI